MRLSSTVSQGLLPTWAVLLSLIGLTQSQYVQWDVERRQSPSRIQRRADSSYEEVINNEKGVGGYFASARLGTPWQNVTLQLDTASSDVWVPYSGASSCNGKRLLSGDGACSLGSFNPDESDTFEDFMQDAFDISYVDNSFAKGDYFLDNLEISSIKIENLTMGLARHTDINYGLLGVGYAVNEASVSTAQYEYPNLPILMQKQGFIESVAYSLWLNDLDASTGNILFGGVDTAKYVGDLLRLSVLKDKNRKYTHFAVHLNSLEARSPSGTDILSNDKWPLEVILDSGTTLTYLPRKIADLIWEEVGAEYNSQIEMAVLPCSYADNPGYFSFGFGQDDGLRINITMDELVVDLTNGRAPEFQSGNFKGERVCQFGIQAGYSPPYTLGDTFLRSAYVVYDLENNEIGLAMTDFNSTETNVMPFKSKGATIPSATMMPESDQNSSPRKPQSTDLTASAGFRNDSGQNATGGNEGGDEEDSATSIDSTIWGSAFLITGSLVVYSLFDSLLNFCER